MFFKTSGCDPPWSMLGIGLDKRIEQHPPMLDVADLRVRFEDDAVEGGEITLDRGGGTICREAACGTRDLENG